MNLYKLFFFAVLAILYTSCKKETHAPALPDAAGTADLKMKVMLVNNEQHVEFDQTFTDGAGNVIKITTMKFFVGHIHITGHEGEGLSSYHGHHLIDLSLHDQVYDLGAIAMGHMHYMNFNIGLDENACMQDPATAGHPFNAPGMHFSGMGYCFFNMEGRVDVDGDGGFDGVEDTAFTLHCGAPDMLREKQLMVHQDIAAGSTIILPLQLNIADLLNGLDLRNNGMHMGGGEHGAQLMDNLQIAIGMHEH